MPAIFLSVLSGNALNKADYTFVILMFAVMIALSICGFSFTVPATKQTAVPRTTRNKFSTEHGRLSAVLHNCCIRPELY